MKKTIAIILALSMLLGLCACAKKEESQEPGKTGIPNPMVAYATLKEINDAVGSNLIRANFQNVKDETYSVIDGTLADYQFTVEDFKCDFRASKTAEDISGVYLNGETVFAQTKKSLDIVTVGTETGAAARWFDGDMQYCLVVDYPDTDNASDYVESMEQIIYQLSAPCYPNGAAYYEYCGTYMDETSGRAVAFVEYAGHALNITVIWADSAFEMREWLMSATLSNKGEEFEYNDCICADVATAENGGQTAEFIYQNGSGYFTFENGTTLYWDGSEDENCTGCVFRKV